jgi:hypothetical protein
LFIYLWLFYLVQLSHSALGWYGGVESNDPAKCQSMQDQTQPNPSLPGQNRSKYRLDWRAVNPDVIRECEGTKKIYDASAHCVISATGFFQVAIETADKLGILLFSGTDVSNPSYQLLPQAQ